MEVTRYKCDICGKEIPEEFSGRRVLAFFERRYTDAAGSMDSDYIYPDLCHNHAISFLQFCEEKFRDHRMAKMWRDFLADMRKKKC